MYVSRMCVSMVCTVSAVRNGYRMGYRPGRSIDLHRSRHVKNKIEDQDERTYTTRFLLEHYSLVAPLRVCQLVEVVAANSVSYSEMPFNAPEHYPDLEGRSARAS